MIYDLLHIQINFKALMDIYVHNTYVTKSTKTGLIVTKYTYSFYRVYLFFRVGYTISVSSIEIFRKFCVYDEICDKVLC